RTWPEQTSRSAAGTAWAYGPAAGGAPAAWTGSRRGVTRPPLALGLAARSASGLPPRGGARVVQLARPLCRPRDSSRRKAYCPRVPEGRLRLSAKPSGQRELAVPPPAPGQPRGLVSVGRRGAGPGSLRGAAAAGVDRLLGLPLVPCEGARVVRGR